MERRTIADRSRRGRLRRRVCRGICREAGAEDDARWSRAGHVRRSWIDAGAIPICERHDGRWKRSGLRGGSGPHARRSFPGERNLRHGVRSAESADRRRRGARRKHLCRQLRSSAGVPVFAERRAAAELRLWAGRCLSDRHRLRRHDLHHRTGPQPDLQVPDRPVHSRHPPDVWPLEGDLSLGDRRARSRPEASRWGRALPKLRRKRGLASDRLPRYSLGHESFPVRTPHPEPNPVRAFLAGLVLFASSVLALAAAPGPAAADITVVNRWILLNGDTLTRANYFSQKRVRVTAPDGREYMFNAKGDTVTVIDHATRRYWTGPRSRADSLASRIMSDNREGVPEIAQTDPVAWGERIQAFNDSIHIESVYKQRKIA